MVNYQEEAKQIANHLLQIKAIILKPSNPFTWASGWKSPIYCDNRKTLSFPNIRTHIRMKICEIIKEKYRHVNVIAGVATGGIAIGCLVAEELGLPFVYVRSSNKEHGKKNLIEGYYDSGQSVVVIEDLISSGKSSLAAVKALKKEGLNIKGLISIFTYSFDEANKNFKKQDCEKTSLCDYQTLIDEALKSNYIDNKDLDILEQWRKNPKNWP